MPVDLYDAIDTLDLAIVRAQEIAASDRLREIADVASRARRRLGYLGRTVLIALAGGTGAGKSSLLNALAGDTVAPAGRRRPTTDQPLAWIPRVPEPGLVRLLDDLGVEHRVGHDQGDALAIIDLPDFDSIEERHRAGVEYLLPRVDAIVWVLDPEKYNDRVVHEGYLRPLRRYENQFAFVLNQVDRLDASQRGQVVEDLRATLRRDGIATPTLFETAADPVSGPRLGIDEFSGYLAEFYESKRVVVGKLIQDLGAAGEEVASITEVVPGSGLDYDRRWGQARGVAVEALTEAIAGGSVRTAAVDAGERMARRSAGGPIGRVSGAIRRSRVGRALGAGQEQEAIVEESRGWRARPGLEAATAALTGVVTDLSFEAGGPFGLELRRRFDADRIERDLRGAAEGVTGSADGVPTVAGRWWWPVASVIQWLVLLAVIGSAIWAWARPEVLSRGEWPWPVIVGAAAVLLGVGVASAVRWSGRKAGLDALSRYRSAVVETLSAAIDRRIGVPLRTVMRSRAELAGALTELALILERMKDVSPRLHRYKSE